MNERDAQADAKPTAEADGRLTVDVVRRLTGEIRRVAESLGVDAPQAIERLVEEELRDLPLADRLHVLRETALQFNGAPGTGDNVEAGLRAVDPNRVASLLLGREIVRSDISSEEISERLAGSLNTVFDSLNRIVATIHAKLLGEERQEETIRHFIDSEIKGETGDKSLQGYLDQIQQAFLIAHQAFQTASEAVIRQFLSELDPEKMMEAAEGRLKFGPLRKAELFELYREQYRRCNGFFESGRVTERLLREFEKTCQRLYQE